jgi:hypothetical protein
MPLILQYQRASDSQRLRRLMWWSMPALALVMLAGATLLFNPVLELKRQLGLGIYGTPACPAYFGGKQTVQFQLFDDESLSYALHAGAYLAIALLLQWLFLMRKGSLRLRLDVEGRPMRRAAIAGGAIAMLLSAGLLATLLDWRAAESAESSTIWDALCRGDKRQTFGAVWAAMAVMWLLWALVFWLYGRSVSRHTALTRIFRVLLAGTILELLVAGPARAWSAYHSAFREECYCARGSYTGLVFGLTAAFWLFGPGIFLLLVREKRRMQSREQALDAPVEDAG